MRMMHGWAKLGRSLGFRSYGVWGRKKAFFPCFGRYAVAAPVRGEKGCPRRDSNRRRSLGRQPGGRLGHERIDFGWMSICRTNGWIGVRLAVDSVDFLWLARFPCWAWLWGTVGESRLADCVAALQLASTSCRFRAVLGVWWIGNCLFFSFVSCRMSVWVLCVGFQSGAAVVSKSVEYTSSE